MNTYRLEKLYSLLQGSNINALAFNAGPTLTYLTGLQFHLSERPVVLLVAPPAKPVLILPELEAAKAETARISLTHFTYGEDPASWGITFKKAVDAVGLNGCNVGVESTRLRFLELKFLVDAAPKAKFMEGDGIFSGLRMSKDADEIAAMRKAVKIAQVALQVTLPHVQPGVTEKAIASELVLQLMRAGSQGELPFAPIVAAGPNSANPHAVPTDRPIQNGDLLVIDWGAAYEGYFSDLTRTFAIGEIDPELRRIHEIVQQANAAGRAAGKPGLPAGAVDAAAREAIQSAGYGDYFIHRTGHGLGMETHEAPYMFAGNAVILTEGMTYTVEPGIYLPGRGGVRIEDDMVITASGSESLSDLGRGLQIL